MHALLQTSRLVYLQNMLIKKKNKKKNCGYHTLQLQKRHFDISFISAKLIMSTLKLINFFPTLWKQNFFLIFLRNQFWHDNSAAKFVHAQMIIKNFLIKKKKKKSQLAPFFHNIVQKPECKDVKTNTGQMKQWYSKTKVVLDSTAHLPVLKNKKNSTVKIYLHFTWTFFFFFASILTTLTIQTAREWNAK